MTTSVTGVRAARSWPRMLVVQALQLPPLALVLWGSWPFALWLGALSASLILCAGTDSQWRWRNRLLVLQAVAWLAFALIVGT